MMRYMIALSLILILLLCCAGIPAFAREAEGFSLVLFPADQDDELAVSELSAERALAWESYRQDLLADPVLREETVAHAIRQGDVEMRFFIKTIGEKPEQGYPLYIALHGGGGSDTPDLNDQQWGMMQDYYSDALDCGVYVAPRGIRDTWDTHFNPESYPLYDRLIRYMILTEDVDPDRVYLEGFSAGGDGVYAVAPRMADRFAAANMSSGHPNGVSMLNMKNLPIQLQAGEYDKAYSRNTVTAEYSGILDALEEEYGGYIHRTLIHYNCGHNYKDYKTEDLPVLADPLAWLEKGDRSILRVNSFPPAWMDQFVRVPLPEEVIWDLSTRAPIREVESFYYLSAPYTTAEGLIHASWDRPGNRIVLKTEGVNGEFSVLLNEQMVNFDLPVIFEVNGEQIRTVVTPSRAVLEQTTRERGDPCFQFEARMTFIPREDGSAAP